MSRALGGLRGVDGQNSALVFTNIAGSITAADLDELICPGGGVSDDRRRYLAVLRARKPIRLPRHFCSTAWSSRGGDNLLPDIIGERYLYWMFRKSLRCSTPTTTSRDLPPCGSRAVQPSTPTIASAGGEGEVFDQSAAAPYSVTGRLRTVNGQIFELPATREGGALRAVALGSCRVKNPMLVLRDQGRSARRRRCPDTDSYRGGGGPVSLAFFMGERAIPEETSINSFSNMITGPYRPG